MNKVNLLIATVLLLAATTAQAADVVGKIGYMSGSLMAKRADGTVKIMGPKSEVLAGDTLVTAVDSYAQVRMSDGSRMTLRPHSTLKIDEYRFDKREPKSDNAIFRLLKGGFRTITGLIGKRGDPDAYKVRAAAATIGIRGTDFSSRLCATANCQDDPLPSARAAARSPAPPPTSPDAAPPGLYVTVHSGQVVMAQAGSVLNLGRGETGFADTAALLRLPAPPAFMNTDAKQTDAIEAKAAKAAKAEESKPGGQAEEGNGNGPQDKEQPDGEPGEEQDNGKPDGETPGEETSDSPSAGGEQDAAAGADENADSPDPSVNQSGCVVQ
jgi:hypothetical protein